MPITQKLKIEHEGAIVDLAVRIRPAGDDLLVCLHGLGCTLESFGSAFDADALARFTICAFDFPGHGRSGTFPDSAYSIQAYADLTVSVIRELDPRRVFLVGHSMGCAAGLVATQELGRLVGGFVSVEGNLVGGDCGLVSRTAAALPEAEFVATEFPRFQAALAASPRADLRAWAGWYAQANPLALHRIAQSLVEWSDSGKLLSLFTPLPRATYVYGTDSGDLSYLLPSLTGVAREPIPHSGHFPMVDNPDALWHAVADAVTLPEAATLAPLQH